MADCGVDSRLLGKPQRFLGSEDEWDNWSFTLRAYVVTLGDATWTAPVWMDSVEALTAEVRNDALGDNARTFSTPFYYILAMLLGGPAMVTKRRVQRGAGLEAWRQLVVRYEKPAAGRVHALLQEILHPKQLPATAMEFETSLGEWEGAV